MQVEQTRTTIIITNQKGHKIRITDLGEALQIENLSKDPCQYISKTSKNVFAFSDAQPKSFWQIFKLLIF